MTDFHDVLKARAEAAFRAIAQQVREDAIGLTRSPKTQLAILRHRRSTSWSGILGHDLNSALLLPLRLR